MTSPSFFYLSPCGPKVVARVENHLQHCHHLDPLWLLSTGQRRPRGESTWRSPWFDNKQLRSSSYIFIKYTLGRLCFTHHHRYLDKVFCHFDIQPTSSSSCAHVCNMLEENLYTNLWHRQHHQIKKNHLSVSHHCVKCSILEDFGGRTIAASTLLYILSL